MSDGFYAAGRPLNRWIDRILRPLGRHVTILVIPHTNLPVWRARFTLNFIVFCLAGFGAVTVSAGYVVGRHVDYWITKADNQIMRARMRYFASEMEKSRHDIQRALDTDREMRVLLGMGTRRAIVESEDAMGGPEAGDRLGLVRRLLDDPGRADPSAIRQSLLALRQESQQRLGSFQEIAWYITHKRSLHRYTTQGMPAEGRITSHFGYRFSPVAHGDDGETNEFHPGIDIANSADTAVLATADGVVRQAGWTGGYGRVVLIDHDWGYATLYGHNSKVLVAPGSSVKRGQMIAYMGTTGRSTGPHLHYEVWYHARPVNPMRFLKPNPADDFQVR